MGLIWDAFTTKMDNINHIMCQGYCAYIMDFYLYHIM